jgi:hypothetical protein
MRPVNSPEGLHRQVFGGARVADNAQNPSINGALMHAEEGFKSVQVALLEPAQDVICFVLHPPFPLLFTLTRPAEERLHPVAARRARMDKTSTEAACCPTPSNIKTKAIFQ